MGKKYINIFDTEYNSLHQFFKIAEGNKDQKISSYIIQKVKNSVNVSDESEVYTQFYSAFHDDLYNKLNHYLIPDNSLIDFFRSTNINKSFDLIEFMEESSNLRLEGEGFVNSDAKYIIQTKKESFLLIFDYVKDKDDNFKYLIIYLYKNSLDNKDIELKYQVLTPTTDTNDKLFKDEDLKFALNFIFYLKAFPDCVIQGVPQDLSKKEVPKTNNPLTINISNQILKKESFNSEGRVVMPHYRSGFFRYYQSDRYKKVKGTYQFIEATMVKGKAFTVENN